MKNLENFGVQELNAMELIGVNGGVDLTKQGYNAGWLAARLLKNFVEGFLPF
ncbi:hypothetical protein GW796_11565 [archaeon]|nr:hypothetical protein [archaeon]